MTSSTLHATAALPDGPPAANPPDHLEPSLEEAEQRLRVALVHSGLAGNERDVRHNPSKPFAFGLLEVREHLDSADLLPRHHGVPP